MRRLEGDVPEQQSVPNKMQAVICHGPQDYRLEEVTTPVPGPGEALVRVEAVGICASDLKCYHGAAKFWGGDQGPAWAGRDVSPVTSSSARSSVWTRGPPNGGASTSAT